MPGQAALGREIAGLAQTPVLRDALAWFGREKQWILERHLQVCRIAAPTFFEQRRAEWMQGQLRELGWEARIDRAGNVVAHGRGAAAGPFVALTAHLDTVLAPRAAEEIRVTPDGRLNGPGVSDNGAGLAALLAVARLYPQCAEELGGGATPLLVANVGEEGEGNLSGMRHLCRAAGLGEKIRAFVVLDGPSTDHITCQALASRRYDINIMGAGGHSWSDYGIGNPVHALSRAVTTFTDEVSACFPNGGPRSSFNFGIIEGGSSIN